jgi:hypothetical protein
MIMGGRSLGENCNYKAELERERAAEARRKIGLKKGQIVLFKRDLELSTEFNVMVVRG